MWSRIKCKQQREHRQRQQQQQHVQQQQQQLEQQQQQCNATAAFNEACKTLTCRAVWSRVFVVDKVRWQRS